MAAPLMYVLSHVMLQRDKGMEDLDDRHVKEACDKEVKEEEEEEGGDDEEDDEKEEEEEEEEEETTIALCSQ